MDNLDRRILYEIAENARRPHNTIAKKTRCSREVLEYRLKKLKNAGIIRGYKARINISNFIYGGYILLIQSVNLTEKAEKKIAEELSNKKDTLYIGRLGGEYDFIIGFTVDELANLPRYTDKVNNLFGTHKAKSTLLTMVREYKDSFRDLFSDKENTNNIVSMPLVKKKINIDNKNREIIKTLGEDCTIPTWKIAEKVWMSEVATRKRIRKLVEAGIILGFRTIIDVPKLDLNPTYLLIKTNPSNSKSEEDFQKTMQKDKQITYVMKTIGEYNYILTVTTNNSRKLADYISKLRSTYQNIITEIRSMPLFETLYHSQI
jgi:Lrp/AsnC family transcriptional regulator, leucine-responsive regulatory protein